MIKPVHDGVSLTIVGLGNLLFTVGLVVNILAVTFTVEEAQARLGELGPALLDRLVVEQNKTTRRRMKNMVVILTVCTQLFNAVHCRFGSWSE